MAPIHNSHFLKRDLAPGVTFSFVFAAVAGSVVIACAIWGFGVPKWRKKHPPSPSKTKWNDGSILTRRTRLRHFPSRPTIKPLLSKPSAAQILPKYDPRTESPFPDTSTPGTPTFMDAPVRTHSAPTISRQPSSNGLFTPVRDSVYQMDTINQPHTIPRAADSKHFPGKSIEFGNAKDFILSIPEPLVLRHRSVRRPSAVTRHLEKYNSSDIVSPTGSDKVFHPKKLFEALQRLEQRSSVCSTTSLKVDHRESDAALAEMQVNEALNKALCEDAKRRQHTRQDSNGSHATTRSATSRASANTEMTTIHRLNSYRSLTTPQTTKVIREGTDTKSKLPALELKTLYTKQEGQGDFDTVTYLPSLPTATTMVTDHGTWSDAGTVSTPTFSPAFARLPATTFVMSIHDKPHRSVTQPEGPSKMQFTNQGELRLRFRASSVYSRDTHGHSLSSTPLTLDFPSPVFDYFTGQEIPNPFKGRESVKDRINQWNQRLDRGHTPPVPLSPLPSTLREYMTDSADQTDSEDAEVHIISMIKEKEVPIQTMGHEAPGGASWI